MIAEFQSIKAVLGLEKSLSDYPALQAIGNSVDAAIDNFLGRRLEFGKHAEIFQLSSLPSRRISLAALPVNSIVSIRINNIPFEGEYTITKYGLLLHSIMPYDHIEIIYYGGLKSLPDDIIRAATIQTMHEFQIKEHLGAETISSAGGTISRPPLGLLPEVKRLLYRYKHPLKWN